MMSHMPKLSVLALSLLSTFTHSVVASTTTLETCITNLGLTSVAPVPTTTYALTIALTATQQMTTTPTRTITPAASQTTLTITSTSVTTTTVVGGTTIYTSTSTVSVTNTLQSTTTSTNVITATKTKTSGTTTVPTSSGFTPLASESGYVPKKRSNPFVPRGQNVQPAARAVDCITWSVSNGHLTCSPTLYPKAVTCGELVEGVTTTTSVATAPTSTITLAASTNTITTTKSVLSTSTSTISASTTKVITSTTTYYTTVYSTADVTKTTTVTDISPRSTTYAACATNNIVSSANGGAGIGIVATTQPNGDEGIANFNTVSGINSAYDCCVACQTYAEGCGGYIYAPEFCSITSYTTTCNPDYFGLTFSTGGGGTTIGNGPCGQIANGG